MTAAEVRPHAIAAFGYIYYYRYVLYSIADNTFSYILSLACLKTNLQLGKDFLLSDQMCIELTPEVISREWLCCASWKREKNVEWLGGPEAMEKQEKKPTVDNQFSLFISSRLTFSVRYNQQW